MEFKDFLLKNGLTVSTEQYFNPDRFYSQIVSQDSNLKVYMNLNGFNIEPMRGAITNKMAIERLIEFIKGKQLKVKGWNSNDEYIDIKIKVPNDLEFLGD